MQILKDWLQFGRGAATPDLTALPEEWTPPHPDTDPVTVVENLREQLAQQFAQRANPHARIKWLELCHAELLLRLPKIEREISLSTLPLEGRPLQTALSSDNLIKAMAGGYILVLEALRTQKVLASQSPLIRLAALRAVQLLGQRQKLACLAYAPASANTWQQIHGIYAYATSQGVDLFSHHDRTLEASYLEALLLAYANPTQFSRVEIPALIACINHFSHHARIIKPSADKVRSRAVFMVAHNDTQAGRRALLHLDEVEHSAWLVDCSHLVAIMSEVIQQRLAGTRSPNDDGQTPDSVLRDAFTAWRGPRARRFARQSFKPRGELVLGMGALHAALASDTVDEGSEWTILDESPDGFGLRLARGNVKGIQVGELVGMRPRERETLHVCLIRRVVYGGASRLEMGVQEVGPVAHPLTLTIEQNRPVPALFFPTLPAYRNVPGLMIEAHTAEPGDPIRTPTGQLLTVSRPLEQDHRYQLWELTSLPFDDGVPRTDTPPTPPIR